MSDIANLVFIAAKKWVSAVDGQTGEVLWRTEVPGSRWVNSGYMTLAADPGGVYACRNGTVTCLDPITGQILWTHRPQGAGSALPVVATMLGGGNDGGQGIITSVLHAQQQAAAAATG